MKKILCSKEGCSGVFAHQLSPRSIEIGRNNQKFLMTGLNWTMFGTCNWCSSRTSVTCENGKINEDELRYKEEEPVDPKKTDEPAPATT
jgi:hypothetical protein